MKFITLEARTEEEYIGNLLLVSITRDSLSEVDALKALWIEAEDYDNQISDLEKDSDFLRERSDFDFNEIGVDSLFAELHRIFKKFENINEISNDVERIKEFIQSEMEKITTIKVLTEDFSSYEVFVILQDKYFLFSWIDVI